ncbi:MAG: sensor domain-containing diguanylate cyclase, partial [Lacipirellulaceae bacterium]
YLEICSSAVVSDEPYAKSALDGIRQVLCSDLDEFTHEYPCHSPEEWRWFLMHVRPIEWSGGRHLTIVHENITGRKLAELAAEQMAMVDALTEIPNRRAFDDFLNNEYMRACRFEQPISLIMLDIDLFKIYNDSNGHLSGDDCLRKIAETLSSVALRPNDFTARYGGEEFAIVLGNTDLAAALQIAERARVAVEALAFRPVAGAAPEKLTISAGVARIDAKRNSNQSPRNLVEAADKQLYRAKESGRNTVCWPT